MIGFSDYRKCGFAIIGIHAMDENRNCTCGREDCQAAGKHPVMSNWQMGIQWEDDQVENMELMGHLKSFGVLTNGYLVVDIDPRNGGNEGYEELCKLIDMELQDESGFVVSTGGGGKHIYFKIPEGMRLKSHDKRFKGIDFKSSGFVIGCGSFHKSGNFYECDSGSPCEINKIPPALAEALSVEKDSDFSFCSEEFSDSELIDMLGYIDGGDDYERWSTVGMAIHEATAGNGFELWDKWSSRFDKYNPGEMMYKWSSFGTYGGARVSSGTLNMIATECGWVRSITFEATQEEIERLEHAEREMSCGVGECPIDYKSVDVRYPPGFVGQITEWINNNCTDERKNLAALAAIHAVSLMAGSSCDIYLTDRKAIANLISIGIAGSGSGKGDVLSALQKLIECSGLNKTVAGKIRSERSVYEGLAANQMFNLVMDEIGIKLATVVGQKVSEYNAGTSAAIMEAYTSDVLYCDQRIVDEASRDFQKKLSQILSGIEENEIDADPEEVKAQFFPVLERIDGAITSPFFSIFGVSSDDQFKKLITEENIKSGLMGRTIIMQELEAIPDENADVNYCDLPMHLQMKIKALINGGSAGQKNWTGSIINHGERKKVKSLPEVKSKAIEFQKWIKQVGREHVENGTGYEPLISRCSVKVAKIAGILAADTGQITMEHLRYAVALTIKSTSDLMMRASSLSGSNSKSNDRRIEGLQAMVIEYVKRSIARKALIRGVANDGKYKQADAERMLDKLISEGLVLVDNEAKRTSNRAIIYRLANNEDSL